MEALPFPQKTSPTPPQLKAATHKKSHWHHFKEAFKILAVVGFMILMYTSGKVVQKVVMTMRDFFASVSLFQLICLIIPIQIVRRGTLPIYIFLGPLSSFFILCIAVNHGYYNGTLIYQFLKLLEPFVIFPLIRYVYTNFTESLLDPQKNFWWLSDTVRRVVQLYDRAWLDQIRDQPSSTIQGLHVIAFLCAYSVNGE